MNELIDILRKVKDKWGQETVTAIIKRIDEEDLKWNGTLRRSVSYEQEDGPDGDISIFMADYGQFQDEGVNGVSVNRQSPFSFKITSIGGVAYHIKPWADSKGLNNWAVARSLVRKGIKPKKFFNDVIEKRIESLGVDIESAVAQYLERSISDINNAQ
jgi:hypothetical protein